MGYFSNGTEGEDYRYRYCKRCVHDTPSPQPYCEVWNAHLLYNGNKEARAVLNMLIPMSANGVWNEQCRMFVPRVPDSAVALPEKEASKEGEK